jgi:hypothetical protein
MRHGGLWMDHLQDLKLYISVYSQPPLKQNISNMQDVNCNDFFPPGSKLEAFRIWENRQYITILFQILQQYQSYYLTQLRMKDDTLAEDTISSSSQMLSICYPNRVPYTDIGVVEVFQPLM